MKNDKYTEQALQALATLKRAAEAQDITQQAIANKTGLIQTNVARTLAGKYLPNLALFLKLADAIGMKVTITTKSPKS